MKETSCKRIRDTERAREKCPGVSTRNAIQYFEPAACKDISALGIYLSINNFQSIADWADRNRTRTGFAMKNIPDNQTRHADRFGIVMQFDVCILFQNNILSICRIYSNRCNDGVVSNCKNSVCILLSHQSLFNGQRKKKK